MFYCFFFFLSRVSNVLWKSGAQNKKNSSVPPPPSSDFSSSVPSTQLRCSLECLSVLGKYLIFNKKKKLNGWIHHFAQVATVATRDRFFAIFGFELYISSYQDKMHLFISFHSITMFKDELVEINQSLVMLIIGFHFWKHVLASLDTCKSHKLE